MIDLRYTLRGLAREPGFTAIAVVALAIGVGSSTAMFTIVDAALVRRLPFVAPERQIVLGAVNGAGERVPMGAAEFVHLAKHVKTLDSIGVFYPHAATVTVESGPMQARVANLSASLFTTLGIAPARGRAFESAEDFAGREPVAIVSDAFWRREMGAVPDAVGRTLQVDHKPVTVIGILPAGVAFPRLERNEIFLPLAITPEQAALPAARTGLYGFARLKPGVDAKAAKAEIDAILHAYNGYGVFIEPLLEWMTGETAPALKAAFAAVLFLLLIACANVTFLLLMRGTARARDLAIRAALGAGQGRVAAEQVAEGVVLAVFGGAIGMVLAVLAVEGIAAFATRGIRIPRVNELHVDLRMAAFALLASLVAGALSGAVSAWHALRSDLFLLLKNGGAGATPGGMRSRIRDGLVVAQLAVALLLASGAGLLFRSMERLSAVPLGLEPKNLHATFVDATAVDEMVEKARAIPGVERAAVIGYLPFEVGRGWDDSVTVEGRHATETTPDVASLNWFSPGYLATAGTRLLEGRDFASTEGAPVAIVNQTFVRKYLAGREPIGALVRLSDWPATGFEVVGLMQDVRQWGPAEDPLPEVYLPRTWFARNKEAYAAGAMLVVKSGLPSGSIAAALRAAASSVLLVGTTKPVDDYLDYYFRQRRFQLDLALGFAASALVLAALGVYGAMAFSVVQRRRELAVRAALGAQARQLFALVLARGGRLALIGISLGVLGALALSRFLAALLYGIGERDPLTLAGAIVTLGAVTLVASLVPALAATRLDPMTVLRNE